MAGRYVHISELYNFRGLDLKSSDLTRGKGFESDGSQDLMESPQGGVKTRYGSKLVTSGYGKVGLTTFTTTSMLGVTKTEVIGFGADTLDNSTYPWVLTRGSFVLTNSHATDAATVTHYYDEATSQFRFKIVRTAATLIDQALGVGTEGSPYMLSSLETAVDALTSFAMSTPTLASTTPAAFMEILTGDTVAANGGTLTVYYYYWAQVASVMAADGLYTSLKNPMYEVGSESCRNVSCAVVRNVLYMSAGTNSPTDVAGGSPVSSAVIAKYDGQDFYRAGFARDGGFIYQTPSNAANPEASVTDSKGTRGPITNGLTGTYTYRASLVRVDKAGNRVEGSIVEGPFAFRVDANVWADRIVNFRVTRPSGDEDDVGYGGRSAHVNGSQSGVTTITVDSGHNMTVGSIAYFWDEGQGRFIQREVTSIAATTVGISSDSLDLNETSDTYDVGGTVSVNDNASISNNVRIAIFRTKANGTTLYLMSERPFHKFDTISGGTPNGQREYDDIADDDLGAEYVEPTFPRDPPPQGRYLCAFNDQLIINGNDLRPNTTFFSDEGPEYFPRDTHEFDIDEKTTGCHQTGEVLAIGGGTSLSIVTGDLINFAFRVSKVGNNIGVTSHHSMQEAMEGVLMFLSAKGPYFLVGGRDLQPLGAWVDPKTGHKSSRLEPYFTQLYGPTAAKPVPERAIAAVLPNDNLYLLFVPTEDPAAPAFATSASVVFAYNWVKDRWDKWTGLNMAGGMAVLDNQLIFTSRAYDGAGTPSYDDIVTYGSQQQKRKAQYNYADHATAITWRRRSHWEALGDHGLFKRFLRCKIFSDETRDASTTAMTLKTYVDRDTSKLSTTDVLSFTTQKELTPKLKSETCRSLQVVFEGSAYYQPMTISGYELEAVANFKPGMKE